MTTVQKLTPQTGSILAKSNRLESSGMWAATRPYWEDARVRTTLKLEWLDETRAITQQLLTGYADLLEAVIATFENNDLVIRVLSRNTSFNEEFERAKASLEIHLSRELVRDFDDVIVQTIPVWGISDQEKASLFRGAIHLT